MSTFAPPASLADFQPVAEELPAHNQATQELINEAPRPKWIAIPFLMPILFAGLSWTVHGSQMMTDLAFVIMLALCAIFLFMEVRDFSKRFGIGGIVVFGGIIVWYCHDYFSNWFITRNEVLPYDVDTVAKAAFFTSVFAFFAVIGLQIPSGRKIIRTTRWIPVLHSSNAYILIITAMFIIGLTPYLFFSSENIFLTFYHSMTGMRTAASAVFTTGRTGNYNYSWGGYLAQVEQVGNVGGILAALYVIMVPGGKLSKLYAALIWLFWCAMGFGTGSRGEMLFMVLPVVGLLMIKSMLDARARGKRFSFGGIGKAGLLGFITLIFIQIQGEFRNIGLGDFEWRSIGVFKASGDTMFTEGLLAYQTFPDTFPFPADTFPGATVIRPIPDVVIRFAIGWIPRVIWHDKPGISETAQWYNAAISGGSAVNEEGSSQNTKGGTVCPSIAAMAYLAYGGVGVIQMGLLFGWLCRVTEDMLRANASRPFALMFALGTAAYLFRAFRDLTPHDYYPLAIGVVVGSFLMWVLNLLTGVQAEQFEEPAGAMNYAPAEVGFA